MSCSSQVHSNENQMLLDTTVNTIPSETPAQVSEELNVPNVIPNLSEWSTPAIPASAWCSTDFLTGVGMVVIQQETQKIVVLYSTMLHYWFFPRGRKDVGESIEQAALREAYEESGFPVQFLPVLNPTRHPLPPLAEGNKHPELNTEPIFMTTTNWPPGRDGPDDKGAVYLTSWFLGQMPKDAKFESGTRTAEEHHFETHLLSYDEAVEKIWISERNVLKYAWDVYQKTLELQRKEPSSDRMA